MHCYKNELYHFGIKGMKWGVRRYRKKDGSLTKAGKKRMKAYAKKATEEAEYDYVEKLGKKFDNKRKLNKIDDYFLDFNTKHGLYREPTPEYKRQLNEHTKLQKEQVKIDKEVSKAKSKLDDTWAYRNYLDYPDHSVDEETVKRGEKYVNELIERDSKLDK